MGKKIMNVFVVFALFSIAFSANLTITVTASDEDCNLNYVKVALYNDSNNQPGNLIQSQQYNVPPDKNCSYTFTHTFTGIDEMLSYWVEGNVTDQAGLSKRVILSKASLSGNYSTFFNFICPSEDLQIKVTRMGNPLNNTNVTVWLSGYNAPSGSSIMQYNNDYYYFPNNATYKELCEERGYTFDTTRNKCYSSSTTLSTCSDYRNAGIGSVSDSCTISGYPGCYVERIFLRLVSFPAGVGSFYINDTQNNIRTVEVGGTSELSYVKNKEPQFQFVTVSGPQPSEQVQIPSSQPINNEYLFINFYNLSSAQNPFISYSILLLVYPKNAGTLSARCYWKAGGTFFTLTNTTNGTVLNCGILQNTFEANAIPNAGFRFKEFRGPFGAKTNSNPFTTTLIAPYGYIVAVFEPESGNNVTKYCESRYSLCYSIGPQAKYNFTTNTCTIYRQTEVSFQSLCDQKPGERSIKGDTCYYNGKKADPITIDITGQGAQGNVIKGITDENGIFTIANLSSHVSNGNWTQTVLSNSPLFINANFSHSTYGNKTDRASAQICPINGQCPQGYEISNDGTCQPSNCQVMQNGQCVNTNSGINVNYQVYCVPENVDAQNNRRVDVSIYSVTNEQWDGTVKLDNGQKSVSNKNNVAIFFTNAGSHLLNVSIPSKNYLYNTMINTNDCTELPQYGNAPLLNLYPRNNEYISDSSIDLEANATDIDKDLIHLSLIDLDNSQTLNEISSEGNETLSVSYQKTFTADGWYKIKGFAFDRGNNYVSAISEFYVCTIPKEQWKDLSLSYSLKCPDNKYTFTLNSSSDLPTAYTLIFNGLREEMNTPTFTKQITTSGVYNIKVYACGWQPIDNDYNLYTCNDVLKLCMQRAYDEKCRDQTNNEICSNLSSCINQENNQLECIAQNVCNSENEICSSIKACLRSYGISDDDINNWLGTGSTGGATIVPSTEESLLEKYGNWILVLFLLLIALAAMWMFYERSRREG